MAGLCRDDRRTRQALRIENGGGGHRVQTHEAHKLQGIGCDIRCQGYLFAKPMSKDHFVGMLKAAAWSGQARLTAKPRPGAAGLLRGLFAET